MVCVMQVLLVQIIGGKLLPQDGVSKSTLSEDKYFLFCFYCTEAEGSGKIRSCKAEIFSPAYVLVYV